MKALIPAGLFALTAAIAPSTAQSPAHPASDAPAKTGAVHATPEQIGKAIDAARKELDKPAAASSTADHSKASAEHDLQEAIPRLEKAWQGIRGLEPAGTDAALDKRLSATKTELRTKLVRAYVALGHEYLQRRAVPEAESCCSKASAIEPQSPEVRRLKQQIEKAKERPIRERNHAPHPGGGGSADE